MTSEERSATTICDEMQAIRINLRGEVSGFVKNARQLMDWQYYVATFPWWSVAATAAAGFVLVPGRRPSRVHQQIQEVVEHRAAPRQVRNLLQASLLAPERKSILQALLGAAASLAAKSVMTYATHVMRERWEDRRPAARSLPRRGSTTP